MADDAPKETEGTDPPEAESAPEAQSAPEAEAAPEAESAPEAEGDTDVSDLPLDESPEAHIRRALDETSGEGGEPAAASEDASANAGESPGE